MNDNSDNDSKKLQQLNLQKLKWQSTTSALKSALDQWEDVSKQVKGPSSDEQMIADMQKLLKQLQEKIGELS